MKENNTPFVWKNRVTEEREAKKEAYEEMAELRERLQAGRHYLMGVQPSELTPESALEAFGFGRNGLTP